MKFTQTEKKQLIIYIIVAYGITYLLGFLMWYGYGKGIDLSAFPNAQMFYPAAGVMIAYLITKKEDKNQPKIFYLFFILMTVVLILCSIGSVLVPKNMNSMGNEISQWIMIMQFVVMGGGIIFWILLLAAGKKRREAYGLNGKNWKTSFLCIFLFVGLFLLRMVIAWGLSGQMDEFAEIIANPTTWIMFMSIFVNFFLAVGAFFGEEYGWRYYLQPLLQKRFGLKGGVLLLGVVWGLWHLPIDFFYYTNPEMGLIACVSQQITCITIGIFMAYVYMKTENIWVPVVIHFLNNNMAVIFSGSYSADVLQGQQIHWSEIPVALILNLLIFGWFIFLKPFREKKMKEAGEI